jgi:hypothetical protein
MDSVWRAKHLSLLTIQVTRHSTHREWVPSPLVSGIDLLGSVGKPGMRAITPTTSKRVRGGRSSVE